MTTPAPATRRGTTARVFLWMYAAAALIALPFHLLELTGAVPPLAAFAIWLLVGLVQLITFIAFAMWLHAAYDALTLLGSSPRYTPGMAVATFFIPFARLFRTKEIVAELYAGSRRRNPGAASWWAGFLASSILADVAAAMANRSTDETPTGAMVFVAAAHLLAALSAVRIEGFVRQISDWQAASAARLKIERHLPETTPPSAELTGVLRALLVGGLVVRLVITRMAYSDSIEAGIERIGMFGALIDAICFAVFMLWLYRVVASLGRTKSLSMSPGLAVAGFFIPLYNFVHGWVVLRRTWNAALSSGDEAEETVRLSIVDLWWLVVWAEVLLWPAMAITMIVMSDLPRSAFDGFIAVSMGLSLLGVMMLTRIVNTIGASAVAADAAIDVPPLDLPLTPAVTPKATWAEVLMPIAAAANEGLQTDTPEVVEARVEAEQQKLVERLLRKNATFYSATVATRSLRMLLLLTVVIGIGEAVVLLVFAPRTVVAVLSLLILGALPVAFPAWLALRSWVRAQYRNAASLDKVSGDPGAASRAILTFREPAVIGRLLEVTAPPADKKQKFVLWAILLRVVQTAPVWLTIAMTRSDTTGNVALLIFVLALMLCLSLLADLASYIDSAFEALHRGAVIPSAAGTRRSSAAGIFQQPL